MSKILSAILNDMFYGIDSNQDDTSVVPAGRLATIYAQSKEFTTMKQRLNEQLEVALGEPLGATPSFATNFFWQVYVNTYISHDLHINSFPCVCLCNMCNMYYLWLCEYHCFTYCISGIPSLGKDS